VKLNRVVRLTGWLVTMALAGTPLWAATAHDKDARCGRECLEGITHKFMDALAQRNPGAAPLAEHVKYTENNVELLVGDGLWGTITGRGPAAGELLFADAEQGQAGLFSTVEEHGVPGYFGVRLKVQDRKISEIEVLVNRIPPLPPGVTPQPYALKTPKDVLQHFPVMSQAEPTGERVSRQRLIDIANGYFSTLQQNDGKLFTPFAADCARIENGNTTAGDPNAAWEPAKLTCPEQFKKGSYRFDSELRARGFMLVDEERQLVLTRGFLDHNAALTDFKLSDGTPAVSSFKTPSSLCLLELFKIRNGELYRVETVYINVPYHMPPVWKNAE
jgi:hypothetical protein